MWNLPVRIHEHDVAAGECTGSERSASLLYQSVREWIGEVVCRDVLGCSAAGCRNEVGVGRITGYPAQKSLRQVVDSESTTEDRFGTQPIGRTNARLKVVVIRLECRSRVAVYPGKLESAGEVR